jgi:hypothetical protein
MEVINQPIMETIKKVKSIQKKCPHNKRKDICVDCGGKNTCEHKRLKVNCIPCGGKNTCEHKRLKRQCKDCKGSSICNHGKRRNRCVDCGGSEICIHKKNKTGCKECKGSGICIHNRQKSKCKDCEGSGICIHGRQKSRCRDCDGAGICEHNNLKYRCKECGGNAICIHDMRKDLCLKCSPNTKAFCVSCRLFKVNNKTNYLCSYCNLQKPVRQKTKEIKLKKWIDENYKDFIYNKKVNMNSTCQTYYPDFLKDCGTFFLIIECDENAHKDYPTECERIRENNIVFALGLPCVFIRYNPDKKGIKKETKHRLLKSYMDYYLQKELSDNEVVYLFY